MTELREPPSTDLRRTQELLAQATSGNEAAWARLFRIHRKYLVVLVKSALPPLTRRRFDAEDVVQAAFLSAWKGIGTFEYRGEGSLRFWLKRIALNELQGFLRHHRRQRRQVSPDSGALSDTTRMNSMVDAREESPPDAAERLEEESMLLDALAKLPERDRDVLIMRQFERLTWPRIAEILEVPESSCRRWYEEAVDRLQREMGA